MKSGESDQQTRQDRRIDILLVEDNPTDTLMAREAFETNPFEFRIHSVENGLDALRFLRREPPFANAPRPGLILLDLNLPSFSGRDVLRELKSDERLRIIPVLILSTSRADEEILNCYHLHANAYITKPMRFHDFTEVARSVREFWSRVATLPVRAESPAEGG